MARITMVVSLLFVFAFSVRVYATGEIEQANIFLVLPDGSPLEIDGIQFGLYEGQNRIDVDYTEFATARFRIYNMHIPGLRVVLLSELDGFTVERQTIPLSEFNQHHFSPTVIYYRLVLTPTNVTQPTPSPEPTVTPRPPTGVTTETTVRVYQNRETGFLDVYIDGYKLPVEGFLQNGRSMIPLRAFSESLNIQVSWSGSLQRVTVYHPDGNVFLFIGSTDTQGTTMVLDSPPIIIQGTTFVPLRFILELFGVPQENFEFMRR